MSRYCFIASDDNLLPEVDSHKPDSFGRIVFNSEDELNDLLIKKTAFEGTYKDVDYYTALPVIYDLDFGIDEKRIEALIDYLRTNTRRKNKYELYQIWLANNKNQKSYQAGIKEGLENLQKVTININELEVNNLISLFNEYPWLKIKIYR